MSMSENRGWVIAFLSVVGVWLAIGLVLSPTFESMVEIWQRSETFAHGYVILPISLWLLWKKRRTLMALPCETDIRAFILVVPLLLLWMVARASGVLVVEQYAFVGLLIAVVWAIMGLALIRAALFPMLFLLLMVPNGEFLISPLIGFTADFTVFVVRLIGIPVFREGAFFSIPSGDWSVVEACSGLRYLIAAITLGTLYAYLTYRSLWKRLAFTLASLVVPVIANGFRASMIVLIAHYSDMKLAVGIDHFIYGWVWFGFVMMMLFWVGTRWREDDHVEVVVTPQEPVVPKPSITTAISLIVVTMLFPLWLNRLDTGSRVMPVLGLSPSIGSWSSTNRPFSDWMPHWVGMDAHLVRNYERSGQQPVMLFCAYYAQQRQGAELVNTQNYMVPQMHPKWRMVDERARHVMLGGDAFDVLETHLSAVDGSQRILVWHWNRLQSRDMLNPYLIKLYSGFGKLSGNGDEGMAYILAAPYQENHDEAVESLKNFLLSSKGLLDRMADQP